MSMKGRRRGYKWSNCSKRGENIKRLKERQRGRKEPEEEKERKRQEGGRCRNKETKSVG